MIICTYNPNPWGLAGVTFIQGSRMTQYQVIAFVLSAASTFLIGGTLVQWARYGLSQTSLLGDAFWFVAGTVLLTLAVVVNLHVAGTVLATFSGIVVMAFIMCAADLLVGLEMERTAAGTDNVP